MPLSRSAVLQRHTPTSYIMQSAGCNIAQFFLDQMAELIVP